jgi:hypothetical protein
MNEGWGKNEEDPHIIVGAVGSGRILYRLQ